MNTHVILASSNIMGLIDENLHMLFARTQPFFNLGHRWRWLSKLDAWSHETLHIFQFSQFDMVLELH